jgi:Cu2+-exporting ATPase
VLLNPESLRALGAQERRALLALVDGNLHPIGRCLHESLLSEGPGVPLEGALEEEVGFGVFLGSWSLGRAGWRDSGPPGPETVLARDGIPVARFRFADSVRPGVARELAELAAQGYGIFILSGDRREKVESLAVELGLPPSHALGGLSPEQKAIWIENHAPQSALMLGDGANDSLAFDKALCRGTPVIHRGILESKADFYYLRRGIGGIRDLLATEGTHRRVQLAIIAFSVAYNVAAAGFAVAGQINPLVAAILMPASSMASLAIVTVGMSFAKGSR